MKAKVTKRKPVRQSRLSTSISVASKKRLRRASELQQRSMGAVLDDLIAAMPEEPMLDVGPGKGKAWVKANRGVLKGKFSKADFDRDDLLGYLLRKHAS
ncbi:MAG: hypothetical protein J5I62_03305 [Flavobacteriales bacterium]|nr:hypothetical protein [Flavobacteriales bacterium]MEB2341129.1 hypothetical protein [Flavobacteriia bacterium]